MYSRCTVNKNHEFQVDVHQKLYPHLWITIYTILFLSLDESYEAVKQRDPSRMPTLNGIDNNAIADEHTITGYKRYDPKHI